MNFFSFFIATLSIFISAASYAGIEGSENIQRRAQGILNSCTTTCLLAKSLEFSEITESIGGLLREGCSDNVGCWKKGFEFLSKYQIPFQDTDKLAQYKVGMSVTACSGVTHQTPYPYPVPFTEDVAPGDELTTRQSECFHRITTPLAQIQIAGGRSAYVDVIRNSCGKTTTLHTYGFGDYIIPWRLLPNRSYEDSQYRIARK